jgi:predicted TIM-barrel fold metal-dependent hydrolase
MILDAHVHVLDVGHWPLAWWNYVAEDWASKDGEREPAMIRDRIESGLIDPDATRMIAHMDAAGVDAAVILPIDWGPDYPCQATPEEIVGHAVACREAYPDRLIPFAGIDPRRDRAADRLQRWITEDGVRGLKLYPPCGWWPDHDAAMDLYAVCADHDLPVLFHTGDPLPLLDGNYSRPIALLPVVKAFPDLKVWLGHAGAPDGWEEALCVAENSNAACLELSVWLWGNSTAADEERLARLIDEARARVGIERILFGTDHVSGKKERPPGFLPTVVEMFKRLPETAASIDIEITSQEMDQIMGLNAARDLKVKTLASTRAQQLGGSAG